MDGGCGSKCLEDGGLGIILVGLTEHFGMCMQGVCRSCRQACLMQKGSASRKAVPAGCAADAGTCISLFAQASWVAHLHAGISSLFESADRGRTHCCGGEVISAAGCSLLQLTRCTVSRLMCLRMCISPILLHHSLCASLMGPSLCMGHSNSCCCKLMCVLPASTRTHVVTYVDQSRQPC